MINDNEYERSKIFFERKIPVHLSKINGTFLNGFLLEVNKNFIIINDKKFNNTIVFYSELKKSIEEFREVGE